MNRLTHVMPAVPGAIALPLVRLFYSARIITNIDGIEWRREKWQGRGTLLPSSIFHL
ncbi:MAG: hypothetical protein ABL911_07960 [Gallionella sp.]